MKRNIGVHTLLTVHRERDGNVVLISETLASISVVLDLSNSDRVVALSGTQLWNGQVRALNVLCYFLTPTALS